VGSAAALRVWSAQQPQAPPSPSVVRVAHLCTPRCRVCTCIAQDLLKAADVVFAAGLTAGQSRFKLLELNPELEGLLKAGQTYARTRAVWFPPPSPVR
jgi:hypothetical protein